MRVLQFGRFWNDEHGGVERHASLLCKGLASRGVEVVNLVSTLPGRQATDQVVKDGYRLIQAKSYGFVVSTAMAPSLPWKALQLHHQRPFDIFHFHLPDPLTHLASALLPRSVPRVITWHSDIIKQKRLLSIYLPLLRREIVRADALVSGTEAHFTSSTQIPADVPANKKHVIPYGLDYEPLELNAYTSKLRENLRQRGGGRPILFALGRHVYYKGFDVLIKAMQNVNALLYLGGMGPLAEQHKAQAATLGLGDRIVFCGRIAEVDLPAYFHACDLFCLPSVEQSEAFGLVQLEAMACGKPVIASQLNNGVNVVNLDGVTGAAVPPLNAMALADTINKLLDDSTLRLQLGRQARRRALDCYSLDSMTLQTLQLYRSLMSDRGG